jgi:hypothetical protein
VLVEAFMGLAPQLDQVPGQPAGGAGVLDDRADELVGRAGDPPDPADQQPDGHGDAEQDVDRLQAQLVTEP